MADKIDLKQVHTRVTYANDLAERAYGPEDGPRFMENPQPTSLGLEDSPYRFTPPIDLVRKGGDQADKVIQFLREHRPA